MGDRGIQIVKMEVDALAQLLNKFLADEGVLTTGIELLPRVWLVK